MIHAMPDKSVRVTSRFPAGHSTMYFNLDRLDRAHGFTLEQDRYRPETFVLHMVGGYSDCAARYSDLTEAEADFADLTTMLADRHHLPAPTSLSTPFGAARRKGWGWKGAVAGLAIGAIGAHFAPGWRAADTNAVRAAALGGALPRSGSGADSDFAPLPSRASVLPPSASLPDPIAPARQQLPSRPAASAPGFGLQQ